MPKPSLMTAPRNHSLEDEEATTAGAPMTSETPPSAEEECLDMVRDLGLTKFFEHSTESELDDELSWEEQNPRSWMAALDAETRQRLTQIPFGWLRFSTCQPIAGGGCGTICVANDGQLNRQVVIKKINPELLHDRAIRRFLNEARITAQLEHPGIPPVYEMGIDDNGLPFYAMKQLRGETLTESLADYGNLQPGPGKERMQHELLQRFLSVCQTVAFAHQHGVIHRDLKPDNIILGQFGETTVVDWGLARMAKRTADNEGPSTSGANAHFSPTTPPRFESNGSLTVQGMVMGTAAYMSPEQAQGLNDRLDQRSDVFSLGVILFELLTGRSPFAAKTLPQTIENVVRCNRMDLQKRLQHCPRALAWICLRALSPTPEGRYSSANELAHDVESWIAGQPISGLRESWFERFDRWAGQNRSSFRTLIAVFVALVVALSVAASFGLKLSVSHQAEHVEMLRASEELQARWELLQAENDTLRNEIDRMRINQLDGK